MSNPSWTEALHQKLSRLPRRERPPRLAIVGIGHELHGDDAVGVLIARSLAARCAGQEHLLILDAGPAPENCTARLRRHRPELILFVDAADMGAAPGTVCWLDWDDLAGLSASTHTFPLSLVARYLREELASEVALLGIQGEGVGSREVGNRAPTPYSLSPPVQTAADRVLAILLPVLHG